MTKPIQFNERIAEVRWSKGSCGNSGCTDPECVCALCAQPIGVPESDPRWDTHDENCWDSECPLCIDDVPITLFRGEGEASEQAMFHTRCFNQLLVTA
jgi:hypothetical protein